MSQHTNVRAGSGSAASPLEALAREVSAVAQRGAFRRDAPRGGPGPPAPQNPRPPPPARCARFPGPRPRAASRGPPIAPGRAPARLPGGRARPAGPVAETESAPSPRSPVALAAKLLGLSFATLVTGVHQLRASCDLVASLW